MDVELQALIENKTCIMVDISYRKVLIGCRRVYKANGSIYKYKAKLVSNGYTKMEGIDYFDTFYLVAKINTIRVLLFIVAIKGLHFEQLDVINYFLCGDLNEEVYTTLPHDLSTSNSS